MPLQLVSTPAMCLERPDPGPCTDNIVRWSASSSSPEFGEHHNCRQVFPPPRGRLLPVPVGRLRGRRQHVRQQRRVSGHVQGHQPPAACGAATRGTAGGRRPHQHAVWPAPVLGPVRGHADQILLRRGHVSHVGHLKCHTCHIVTRTSCHSK